MRISAEQATRTARYLHTKGSEVDVSYGARAPISDEFLSRVVSAIQAAPEVRPERVCAGRKMLADKLPSPDDVAERILWRAIADGLH